MRGRGGVGEIGMGKIRLIEGRLGGVYLGWGGGRVKDFLVGSEFGDKI
jgi:hypothetical protein